MSAPDDKGGGASGHVSGSEKVRTPMTFEKLENFPYDPLAFVWPHSAPSANSAYFQDADTDEVQKTGVVDVSCVLAESNAAATVSGEGSEPSTPPWAGNQEEIAAGYMGAMNVAKRYTLSRNQSIFEVRTHQMHRTNRTMSFLIFNYHSFLPYCKLPLLLQCFMVK